MPKGLSALRGPWITFSPPMPAHQLPRLTRNNCYTYPIFESARKFGFAPTVELIFKRHSGADVSIN